MQIRDKICCCLRQASTTHNADGTLENCWFQGLLCCAPSLLSHN